LANSAQPSIRGVIRSTIASSRSHSFDAAGLPFFLANASTTFGRLSSLTSLVVGAHVLQAVRELERLAAALVQPPRSSDSTNFMRSMSPLMNSASAC
jgi:hypothetical protein